MNGAADNTEFPIIDAQRLRALIEDVFRSLDVAADETRMVADALMEATLSGYDAHGVMRVARYADELRSGRIVANADFKILNQTYSVAYVDACRALGPVTATRAVELACVKATAEGIGCVSTKNSNDIGRLGSYVLKPARSGLLILIMVNDSGGCNCVAPFGGADRFFSTNPLAAGIPTDDEPIVIDMSTSVISLGRLRTAANRGDRVPEGWLIDRQGNPVVEPSKVFADQNNVVLQPLGGRLAGYKGFALQLLVEVLTGALGGGGVCTGQNTDVEANAMLTIAIDPEHFVTRDTFCELVAEILGGLKNVNTLPGIDQIRIPGQRAAKQRRHRQEAGIPLDSATCRNLRSVLDSLGLADKYRDVLGDPS